MIKKKLYITIALIAMLVAIITGINLSADHNANGLTRDNIAGEAVGQPATEDEPAQSNIIYSEDSFAYFLQNLPIKHGVYYWNGELKNDNLAIDFDVS